MSQRILIVMVSLVAVVVLMGAQSPVVSTDPEVATANGEVAANEDFPYPIDFERGAQQFNAGDQITIDEVRSTSKDMQSGICRISGTYTLSSEEEATLAASVTANRKEDGTSNWNSAQRLDVTKGSGKFVLMLPISIEGMPHVSFYNRTTSVGGIYIGTGDGVLRKWWGTK